MFGLGFWGFFKNLEGFKLFNQLNFVIFHSEFRMKIITSLVIFGKNVF